MLIQKDNESRLQYLARVLFYLMNNTRAGSYTVDYDGTNCDGACLANDILAELEMYEEL